MTTNRRFLEYLLGGAIKDERVFLFFALILALPGLLWLIGPPRAVRDAARDAARHFGFGPLTALIGGFRELLPLYIVIVLIANIARLSIWWVLFLNVVWIFALFLGAAVFQSRLIGARAIRLGMLTGAFAVFLAGSRLSLVLRLPLTILAYNFFNVFTHRLHNQIVPPLIERLLANRASLPNGIESTASSQHIAFADTDFGTPPVSQGNRVTFTFSVSIEASREEVFRLLSDLVASSAVVGAPNVAPSDQARLGLGARWIARQNGVVTEVTCTIYEPLRRLRREFRGGHTGVIEDRLRADGEGTMVTRQVDLENPAASEAALKSEHLIYFERLTKHLETQASARHAGQLESEAHDQTVIAKDRARIIGQVVPQADVARLLGLTFGSQRPRTSRFGRPGYPHCEVLAPRTPIATALRPFVGPIDLYVTCLFGVRALSQKKAFERFMFQAEQDLVGQLRRIEVILPTEGHEADFWRDAVTLLEYPENDTECRHVWTRDRCFLLLTRVHPAAFAAACHPLVSLDISNILPTEVRWIVISIGRLGSACRFIPFGMPSGFGKSLFEQRLVKLATAGDEGRSESALDILSLPVLITPSLTIDFKYFDAEVRRRFESICEETLESRPGALPYSTVLRDRQAQRATKRRTTASLPGEESIRAIWD